MQGKVAWGRRRDRSKYIHRGRSEDRHTRAHTHMHTYIQTHTLSMYRVKSGKNKEERKMGCYPDQAEKSGLGKKTVIKK